MTITGWGRVVGRLPVPAEGAAVHAILIAPDLASTGVSYLRQESTEILGFSSTTQPFLLTDELEGDAIDPGQFVSDGLLITYFIR